MVQMFHNVIIISVGSLQHLGTFLVRNSCIWEEFPQDLAVRKMASHLTVEYYRVCVASNTEHAGWHAQNHHLLHSDYWYSAGVCAVILFLVNMSNRSLSFMTTYCISSLVLYVQKTQFHKSCGLFKIQLCKTIRQAAMLFPFLFKEERTGDTVMWTEVTFISYISFHAVSDLSDCIIVNI